MSSIYASGVSAAGSDARTNVVHATERLKARYPDSISTEELIAFVYPVHKREPNQINLFKRFLQINPKVGYDAATDSYTFKPLHNIANADDLLSYLQKQDTAIGIRVAELKDGWPEVEEAIDQLEKEHKLLVFRKKKDNHAQYVWANDPTLIAPLDQEFKDLWNQVALPSVEDTIRELKRMNHKSTGEVDRGDLGGKVEKKKKKVRRGVKVTNVHMQGLFRDYSNQRPQGGK
jgi:transcription initiation factor TFIIE subunit beta